MNVSMQDAFNLGWKLAAVLRGRSAPQLLHSYSAERQAVAKELIDFDREWAEILASAKGDSKAPAFTPRRSSAWRTPSRFIWGASPKQTDGSGFSSLPTAAIPLTPVLPFARCATSWARARSRP